jgi:hypothetical protein
MMRNQVTIRWAAIAILLCCMHGQSLGQTLDRPTTPTSQSAPKRQGFFDYALGKINPHGIDYGASMESGRNAVVENTIDDLYFWSNVVTLLLLSGLVAIVLLQWRAADKREVIAASLIAQLWNGRVSDRIEIERRPSSSISWSKPITPMWKRTCLRSQALRNRMPRRPEA